MNYSLTLRKKINNSKIVFSKDELSKILSCYSLGVSKGTWKDYALNSNKNEANFFIFKHSYALPDCIVTKSKKIKKNKIRFCLNSSNKKHNIFNKIDDLITVLKRNQFRLIKN